MKHYNTSSRSRILFFDSGVGGLTIYSTVTEVFGNDFEYFYYFDNQLFPYSEKLESLLCEQIVLQLVSVCKSYNIDVLVIACNTASTVVLPVLKKMVSTFLPSMKIIGVVPAIKSAAEWHISNRLSNKSIGLLATKGTIKRQYTKQLISEYCSKSNLNVDCLGTTDLVELVEDQIRNTDNCNLTLEQILAPWLEKAESFGSIVLACTHFTFVKEQIQQLFPNVRLIDSCMAIAKRIAVLTEKISSNPETQNTEFDKYIQNLGLSYPHQVYDSYLFSTKKLTEDEFSVFKKFGFCSYTFLPYNP